MQERGEKEMQKECVLCLGFFDGLHRGHQVLLQAGKKAAEKLNLPLCAHTFDRSPSPFKRMLTGLEERKALLKEFGADYVYVTTFDEETRRMPGDVFFRQVMLEKIGARYVICGEDHRFGYQGGWDAAALARLCREAGIGFEAVPAYCLEGEKVSSTAIRTALLAGDEKKAEELLGREIPARWKQVSE